LPSLREAFATRVVDPIVWTAKGMPIGARFEEFRRGQWDDATTIRARQTERLRDLLIHAITRVPFYKERTGGLAPHAIRDDPWGSLQSFPILTKEDIRYHLDELTCDMGRGRIPERTGGSTGLPLHFYRDRHSMAASLGSTQLFFEWAGLERGERRVRLWGAPQDFASQRSPAARFLNYIHDRTLLDAFSMGDETMREYVRFLNRHPPVSLEGYTSAVYSLAQFIERQGLEVPPPRAVIVGASTLFQHMRETIGEVYRAPVFDHYGSHEVGVVAAECGAHDGLHVLSETIVLEAIGDDGRLLQAGEVGELVATNLWEYSMPFIRYEMGDRGVLSPEPCGCGRAYPLLREVVGRSSGCLVRADGGVVVPEIITRLFGLVYNTGDVRSFQAVQEAIDRITIRVELEPDSDGLPPDAQEGIASRIREAMGAPCEIEFVVVERIEPAASGKHLYVISKVDRDVASGGPVSAPAQE